MAQNAPYFARRNQRSRRSRCQPLDAQVATVAAMRDAATRRGDRVAVQRHEETLQRLEGMRRGN